MDRGGPVAEVRDRGVVMSLRGVSKSFAGVQALSSVDLDLRAGEVHALLGENGAGKSTLMKILFGVVQPNAGEIVLDGQGRVSITDPRHALELGIGLVSQELSLVPQLEVSQNIFLGQPHTSGIVNRARLRTQAARILATLSSPIQADALVSSLSMAERQVVEIARTLARGGRVIAFDEPTSSLTSVERDGLFSLIADLKRAGKAIVYISHRMQEIGEVADRVTILRDGRVVAAGPIAEFGPSELNQLIVGRTLNEEFSRRPPAKDGPGRPELLRIENVSTLAVKNVSLAVQKGEIFGLGGLVGSGRTELLKAIFGADRLTEGRIVVGDRAVELRGPLDAIAAGIALIPEDRRGDGLVPLMDIQRNLGLGNERLFSRFGVLLGGRRRRRTEHYVDMLSIRPRRVDTRMRNLSGGNQQKVIIARWLCSDAKVFLFDEPTRGIDIGAKSEIHAILRDLAAKGAAILVVSSELPELMSLSDRIGIMRGGRLTKTLANGPALTEEKLMALAAGENG